MSETRFSRFSVMPTGKIMCITVKIRDIIAAAETKILVLRRLSSFLPFTTRSGISLFSSFAAFSVFLPRFSVGDILMSSAASIGFFLRRGAGLKRFTRFFLYSGIFIPRIYNFFKKQALRRRGISRKLALFFFKNAAVLR